MRSMEPFPELIKLLPKTWVADKPTEKRKARRRLVVVVFVVVV